MKHTTYSLKQLAELVNGTLVGDPARLIAGIADLESATESDVSFFSNSRYATKLKNSKAGVVLAQKEHVISGIDFIVVADPSASFQKLIELFCDDLEANHGVVGVDSTAAIDPACVMGASVAVGPHVVIGKDVHIGEGTIIHAGCVIERSVKIGDCCVLYPHVVLREGTILHNRVILQPGVVVGSCGFGYATDKRGMHTKLKQMGCVIIEDDVEIGANSTIDKSRFNATRIGRGTKIDNLVQIGHGVEIGKHCIIVAQTGIAGSTKIGDHVVIGGQVGISGHLEIAGGVSIAAKSGVSKSLLEPGQYGGVPAVAFKEYQRQQVEIRKLGRDNSKYRG